MILFHKGIKMESIIEKHLKNIKQPILINNVIVIGNNPKLIVLNNLDFLISFLYLYLYICTNNLYMQY